MFPEPPTLGPPAPDALPDSSRISYGPGEPDPGPERRESPARIIRAGFGRVYWAGGLENPGGIVVGIMDWTLNEMENEQVRNKNENHIEGCGMDWNLGLVQWKVHLSLLLKIQKLRPSERLRLLRASGVELKN